MGQFNFSGFPEEVASVRASLKGRAPMQMFTAAELSSRPMSEDSKNNNGLPNSDDFSDEQIVKSHVELSKNKHEPTKNFLIAPLVFVFVFGCLIFVCSIQLAHSTNSFQLHPPVEVVELTPEEKEAQRLERKISSGEKVFAARCASCHQANGLGIAGQFPPLAGSEWVELQMLVS